MSATNLNDFRKPPSGCVLSVGNFDGVHAGHTAILSRARGLADALHLPLIALTFEPHPLVVVAPDRAPATLTPLDEKVSLLLEAGADQVVVARSEPVLLEKSARAFIAEIVVGRLNARHVVEGRTFGFGAGRRGDVDLLAALGPELGFVVVVVEPVCVALPSRETVQVSSSLIRRLLTEGAVEAAAACLNRTYVLSGQVGRGHGRGKALGFATANLRCAGQLIPGEGVYAGFGEVEGARRPAAISIGRTPTFGDNDVQVEAHLLDCREELLGRRLRLGLVARLRDQRRFDSPAALAEQIARDVEAVRKVAAEWESKCWVGTREG